MSTYQVELPDGRRLELAEGGDPAGVVVVVHHGTPGGAVLHPAWVSDARERGLRLVTYARPGYGASTRQPGRAVGDAAPDVAAIADALGADRFLTWGFSGGGPHALACAALLPGRVVAAAALAAIAPYGSPGLDFLAGMGEGNVEEFGTVLAGGEEAFRPLAEEQAAQMAAATAPELADAFAPFLSAVDAAEIRGPIAATLLAQIRAGCATGADGWIDDDLAYVRPWGFDVADITVPVQLCQGRHDAMVPYAHGQWLAAHIPGVDARLSDDDGHLTLVTQRVPDVHRWLRGHWDAPEV